jgi:hypothetical protein
LHSTHTRNPLDARASSSPKWDELQRDVRIIAKRTLVQFWESGHGDAEQPIKPIHNEAD